MGSRASDRIDGGAAAAGIAPVVPLHIRVPDDRTLVDRLRRGDRGAAVLLYDRHAPHLRRVLARILGVDSELPDLLHEAFANILAGVGKLRDPERLKGWMTCVAVYTARRCIRRRRLRRWLEFRSPEQVPEVVVPPDADREAAEALRRTYALLDRLGVDERTAFALRHIDGMPLGEVAEACGVSLATVKRRLARAETRFVRAARGDPVLAGWVDGSPRWRDR
jgi:RNA polymerase sigma-70 factor (ECF subfamily)